MARNTDEKPVICGMRQAFIVSRIAYIGWITSPRMLIVPIIYIFFYELSLKPMAEHADMMSVPLNLFEPFIVLTNNSITVPLVIVLYMLLISDCPRLGSGDVFIVYRAGRARWLAGQFVFMLYTALTYLSLLFSFCCAVFLDRAFIANGWSEATRFIRDREDYSVLLTNAPASIIEENLFMQSRIYSATARSFLLIFLYLLVIAGVILLFNILKRKTAGIIVSFGVIALGLLSWSSLSDVMWIFPMANSIYGWHNQGLLAEQSYDVANSYAYFASLLCALAAASLLAMRRSPIHAPCNDS